MKFLKIHVFISSQNRNPFPISLVKFSQDHKTIKENWLHQAYRQKLFQNLFCDPAWCRNQKGYSFQE